MRSESVSAGETLQVLHELGILLQDNPWTTPLAQNIVEVLEGSMGYELLAVLVVTKPGEPMQPVALSEQGQDSAFLEADKAHVESRCTNPGLGLTNWVARTGESIRVGKVADDSRYFGIRDDIQSELCVPLLLGGEMVGVINTETTIPNAYGAADQQFLETAASHIAIAIKHSQRHGFGLGRAERPDGGSPLSTACMYCKKIELDRDHWIPPDEFLLRRFGVLLSHGVCPPCCKDLLDTESLE